MPIAIMLFYNFYDEKALEYYQFKIKLQSNKKRNLLQTPKNRYSIIEILAKIIKKWYNYVI